MAKRQTGSPLRQRSSPPAGKNSAPALKAALNRQVRKLLGKHYRAKYGVK
jgi:hypothetical protein